MFPAKGLAGLKTLIQGLVPRGHFREAWLEHRGGEGGKMRLQLTLYGFWTLSWG